MRKGKIIKQVNNLVIRETGFCEYSVWTKGKNGKCLKDGIRGYLKAYEFCYYTKDYLKNK